MAAVQWRVQVVYAGGDGLAAITESPRAQTAGKVMENKNERASSFDTGVAAEYFVLSQIYRLGLEAYISQGNKKAIDIRVIQGNGNPISIDVKAVRGYSSLVVNNVKVKDNHFVVFVIYNNKFENLLVPPDIYVVPSSQVPAITKVFKEEKRVMKGDLEKYKNNWNVLRSDN